MDALKGGDMNDQPVKVGQAAILFKSNQRTGLKSSSPIVGWLKPIEIVVGVRLQCLLSEDRIRLTIFNARGDKIKPPAKKAFGKKKRPHGGARSKPRFHSVNQPPISGPFSVGAPQSVRCAE